MSAILGYKKYGVPKSIIIHMMQNHFHFPTNYQDCLEHYELLYWSTKWFKKLLTDGTITKDDITYHVIYQHCTPAQLKDTHNSQVALSFRAAQKEYNAGAYVLIRKV